jgi:DNA-binding SARP family transcriptional activator
MARLRMCLLGGFEPRLDETPATWRLPRKVSGLLAYLATRRGRPSPRAGLGAMLWGGSRPEEARHSVRQALLSTRQALSGAGCADALVAEGDTLALDPAFVEVDVLEFEDRLDQGTVDALEHAAALYRGEFLDGFCATARATGSTGCSSTTTTPARWSRRSRPRCACCAWTARRRRCTAR